MAYNGIVKKSRTIDLAILNKVVDMAAATFILYEPEQIGISVPVYLAVRLLLNAAAIYLRHKTNGPVGEK